nr:unnamed protein product [Digitaria exilis]
MRDDDHRRASRGGALGDERVAGGEEPRGGGERASTQSLSSRSWPHMSGIRTRPAISVRCRFSRSRALSSGRRATATPPQQLSDDAASSAVSALSCFFSAGSIAAGAL